MSVTNSKKTAPSSSNFEWAGAVARIRRGAVSNRAGRRSALLGLMSSIYANSSRGTGRGPEGRSGSDRG